ncbi:arginine--tRNA ligase [Prochlorococcus marinus]|uniref:arginine--tRNA ligase n=1 Tax=Prochlorococcus marinus TaxID=1219 RepID=UPI0022B540DE|nr:arginine--tRNA ligase [Prochlorococcus marinus]
MQRVFQLLKKEIENTILSIFPETRCSETKSGFILDSHIVPASKPEFGDFQINSALSLAKVIKQPPRHIAEAIVKKLEQNQSFNDFCLPAQIAGPGFINLTIKNNCLADEIQTLLKDSHLGVPRATSETLKNTVKPTIIDFSSPNIAKEMHVGHLRSTIIGDSIARILKFRGHPVIRLNHVGDWGTQFGMLITYLKLVAPEALKTANVVDLGDLVEFYRQAKKRFDEDTDFKASSRKEVVKLQAGDEESLRAWNLLCEQSRKEFQILYNQLEIDLNERGESFYNPYLEQVVLELKQLDLLVSDQGAQCVFLEGITSKNGRPLPLIVQKSDGGFNYATTDLAAIRYRFQAKPNGDGADRIIYVTDAGQANHFSGVFQVAERAGWIPESGRLDHVPFGLVQGEDGKKLKTRSGDTVRLKDLLNEAVNRAKQDVEKRYQEEGRIESPEFINEVATKIGIGAVKYADLSQNRITNYQFSFDRMLSLQGNTAPYLLYALVRIKSICKKSGGFKSSNLNLEFHQVQEWNLVRQILKFDDVIIEVEEELLPNRLCSYLYELSQVFNRFYDQIPVLKAKDPSRSCRLILCQLTGDILSTGLNLLGISTLERM